MLQFAVRPLCVHRGQKNDVMFSFKVGKGIMREQMFGIYGCSSVFKVMCGLCADNQKTKKDLKKWVWIKSFDQLQSNVIQILIR